MHCPNYTNSSFWLFLFSIDQDLAETTRKKSCPCGGRRNRRPSTIERWYYTARREEDDPVGVIGGAPTCSKTWLGLDLALSVATGTACLGNYAVPEPGPVLVYLELVATDAETTHLEVVAALHGHRQRNLQDEARALLAHGAVFTRAKLRDALSVKNERLGEALTSLQEAGRIRRTAAGWQRVN